jgi:hypothetical protein
MTEQAPWASYPKYDGAPNSTAPEAAPLAVGGQSPWSAYPVYDGSDAQPMAQPAKDVDVATDMVRAAPAGLAKGASYVLGTPGDLAQLGKGAAEWIKERLPDFEMHEPAFMQWLREKTEESKKHDPMGLSAVGHGDIPGTYEPPTSQQIRGTIEDRTGPLYEAQSRPGKAVDTALSFVPAALMGGEAGPALQMIKQGAGRVIKQGLLPGVASEGAGQATEGTAMEPWARAGAAIATGGAASLLNRPSTAEQAIAHVLPGGIDQTHVAQAERLIQDAQQRGIALTWPEALSQVAGRPVLSDAMRIAESSPHSRDATQAFFAERPSQIGAAAGPALDNIGPSAAQPSYIGPQASQVATQTVKDVRAAINRATKPMYDAAGQTLVPQAVHAAMIQDPLFVEALERVRNDPARASYIRGAASDRSIKVYDAVAKELEERGENAARPINPNASQAVAAANNSLGSDVKDIAIAADRNAANGPSSYEAALATQTRLRDQYLNPLLAGPLGKIADAPTTKAAIDALFPSNPLPNSHGEVSHAVGALAQKNPMVAAQLVRAHAESVFNEAMQRNIPGENQMGGAKFAAQIVGNPQQRANLQAAVEALPGGQQRWAGFERFLDIMQATGTRQAKGSLTAFNERELQRMSTGGAAATVVKHGASPGEWWSLAHDAIGKWQLGRNLNQIADILTNPRSGPLLQKIVQIPPKSSQAVAIAARLIAQANVGARGGDGAGRSAPAVDQPYQ